MEDSAGAAPTKPSKRIAPGSAASENNADERVDAKTTLGARQPGAIKSLVSKRVAEELDEEVRFLAAGNWCRPLGADESTSTPAYGEEKENILRLTVYGDATDVGTNEARLRLQSV